MTEPLYCTGMLSERFTVQLPPAIHAAFMPYRGYGVLRVNDQRWRLYKPSWFFLQQSYSQRLGFSSPSYGVAVKISRSGVLTIPPALRHAAPGVLVLEMVKPDSHSVELWPLVTWEERNLCDAPPDAEPPGAWGTPDEEGEVVALPIDWLSRLERRISKIEWSWRSRLFLMGLFQRLRPLSPSRLP